MPRSEFQPGSDAEPVPFHVADSASIQITVPTRAKSAHFSVGRWENLTRNALPALRTIHLIKNKRREHDLEQQKEKGVYVR